MPVYFVKRKKGYSVRKMEKKNGFCIAVLTGVSRNKEKLRYGIPAYTGPFRALGLLIKREHLTFIPTV
jgi:hypothetical protein